MRTFEQWAESAGYQPPYLRRDTGEFRDGIQDVFEAYSAGLNEAAEEIERLRAKIEAMEQQEPVMWANSANIASAKINQERGGIGDQHTCTETRTTYHDAPLYQASGAQWERSTPISTLSEMFLSLDGYDTNQSGYSWRKGWNDAIRQALNYSQPAPCAQGEKE